MLPKDVKDTARCLVIGYEARRKRAQTSALEFDRLALQAVEQGLLHICGDIIDEKIRTVVKKKVYESLVYSIPYHTMGECYCCKDKFYLYRRHLLEEVSKNMGMYR